MIALALLLAAGPAVPATELGKAAGRCRPGENGSAVIVDVIGLKDRSGRLKLELYPGNDPDFLADDTALVAAGKAFSRIEVGIPPSGAVELCIRAPGPGVFGLSLLHDRDLDHRFNFRIDGVGFTRNPRLGLSQPKAAAVAIAVPATPVRARIVMNYRRGLFSFGPLER